MSSYHVIIITVVFLIAYLVSVKKLDLIKHKRIWNFILAISFLISGILGLVLAIIIDLNIRVDGYRYLLWWHVEFGIAMALTALCHLIWHVRYYFPKK